MEGIDDILGELLTRVPQRVLIFVLGAEGKEYFEKDLPKQFTNSSVQAITNSKHYIKVMFLEKLQYLFMYLTKFETQGTSEFEFLVIYGLDNLLDCKDTKVPFTAQQMRLTNLIYNISFKVSKLQKLDIKFIPFKKELHPDLDNFEKYWHRIA